MTIDLLDRFQLEILNKRGARYNLQDAEKDYFLAIILKVLYDSKLKDNLVFKGGTAIYHCYLDQIRFSKDLDFTAKEKFALSDIKKVFSGFEIFKLKDLEEKKFGLAFSVQYTGVLAQPDTIEVDININQKVLLEPKIMEYRNYYGVKLLCPVMNEEEVFAEKIRTINDRARPRDPFDLVILQKKLGLKIDAGLALLAKKEMFRPLDKKRIAENLRISQERFDDDMEELYYRERVSKAEIKELAKEILGTLQGGIQGEAES